MPIGDITPKHVCIRACEDAEFRYCKNVHQKDVEVQVVK